MPAKTIPGNEQVKGAMVTVSSEAFGLILVKNCWDKWSHIVPEKAKDPKWVIPKYDPKVESTWKYHKTLWSDGRNGQKKGQGWTPEGYEALNKKMIQVKEWRANKDELGPKLKRILNAVKASFGISLDEKDPPAKKRKKKTTDEPAPKYARIMVDEADEDEEWETFAV